MAVFAEPLPSNDCLYWLHSSCLEQIYHNTFSNPRASPSLKHTSTRRPSWHCLGTFETRDYTNMFLPVPKCSISHYLPSLSLLSLFLLACEHITHHVNPWWWRQQESPKWRTQTAHWQGRSAENTSSYLLGQSSVCGKDMAQYGNWKYIHNFGDEAFWIVLTSKIKNSDLIMISCTVTRAVRGIEPWRQNIGTGLIVHKKIISALDKVGFVSDRMSYVILYSIYFGNESASLSVSDLDRYVITGKLLDFIFNIFPTVILQWGIQTRKIFSPLPLFWKKNYAYEFIMLSLCLWITVFECLNQSLWNLVYISWHLSPSQRCT
jgi:hypothetical protein